MKTNILATLALSTVVATGCVNLETIRQFSNHQTVLTQSTSSQQTTPERFDGKLEKSNAPPADICSAYNKDHKNGPDEYPGKIITVTENLNHYRADVGDTLEFGWDKYGAPNRYYTMVEFNPGNYGIQITFKDFTKATDWEKGRDYKFTAQVVSVGFYQGRCHIKLSNGYIYRSSSIL